MTKLLLSIHVLAAILAIGPIAVAASLFPRYARFPGRDGGEAAGGEPGGRAVGIAALLHRVCRVYAVAGIAVPVFGIATGAQLGVLTDAWLTVSLALTAIAAALLALAILPRQKRLLASLHGAGDQAPHAATASRLAMLTGVFNLLWAAVVVLMIVRPGSTTGT
ncbi:membrane protein [Streptomyces albidochromogenes]|uniref:hypothetical protein n=1 Tax=Streptomyces albidochromogenes TaxID=329524 RepID=UPI00110FAB97|nr:hypothetical protein [Streptomyces albidochromogenes]